MAAYLDNPMRTAVRSEPLVNLTRAFHLRMPGYAPTPLLDMRDLAQDLGIERVWVKDESARLGTPSFEILGAAWALYRALLGRSGGRPARWESFEQLLPAFEGLRPLRVVAVSDDEFSLAVARAARLFEIDATVFVPAAMAVERLDALAREGATVVTVAGGYDEALAAASTAGRDEDIVLSDSSWPGYDEVPRWVTDGYVTVFEEVDDELAARTALPPGVVVVPLGTGALAAAAARYFRTERFSPDLRLVGVEPEGAACFTESVVAGQRRALPGPAPSIMGGLGRGLPSPLAFPLVAEAFDGFVSLSDDEAQDAVDRLEADGVQTTPAGAAALGAIAALGDTDRAGAGLTSGASVLVVNIEGPIPTPPSPR
jgi:diaminopropionate ammonia-lyase